MYFVLSLHLSHSVICLPATALCVPVPHRFCAIWKYLAWLFTLQFLSFWNIYHGEHFQRQERQQGTNFPLPVYRSQSSITKPCMWCSPGELPVSCEGMILQRKRETLWMPLKNCWRTGIGPQWLLWTARLSLFAVILPFYKWMQTNSFWASWSTKTITVAIVLVWPAWFWPFFFLWASLLPLLCWD